jgi:hypothetical protein
MRFSRFKKNPLHIPSSQKPARNFIITIFICSYFVTVTPVLYFLHKNYLVLDEIGYKFFPTLLDVNTSDKILIISLLCFSFVIGLGIQLIAQRYFLKKLYRPIDMVQSHISKLILGDFNQPKIPLKQDPYVHELIKTYNYFYSSLQTNLKRDITFLQELEEKYDPKLASVLKLEKMEQLNLKFKSLNDFDNSSEDKSNKIDAA